MVVLNVKIDGQSQFLYETTLESDVTSTAKEVAKIQNGRLKVTRISRLMEDLSAHGPAIHPKKKGLLEEQIKDLKLDEDPEVIKGQGHEPEGGFESQPDPLQRRCGQRPKDPGMQKILEDSTAKVLGMISGDLVKENKSLDHKVIEECLAILRGAVSIVYPMNLPEYDPIRMELEDREDLAGTQDSKLVLDPDEVVLWFANKELKAGNKLKDHLGKHEKTKVVVKQSTRAKGQPSTEPSWSPETMKKLQFESFKRMEEIRKLERDDDDSYLNSNWADQGQLKRRFNGLNNISWKP